MPRKTLKQRKGPNPSDTKRSFNRVRSVIDNLYGNEKPDDIMRELISVLQQSPKIPSAGKFYIFVYRPKTPNIQYDQNPFVAVTDVYQWGFKGINMHWGEMRQYTWDEIPEGIYEIYKTEVKDLQALPLANIKLNS
jgi:hypothetical protein